MEKPKNMNADYRYKITIEVTGSFTAHPEEAEGQAEELGMDIAKMIEEKYTVKEIATSTEVEFDEWATSPYID